MVAGSFFAKTEVIETITGLGMHFICRLRDDAALQYLNREPKKGGKGRPKKYNGPVITAKPDMSYFKLVYQSKEVIIYIAIAYNPAWKRNVNLSITVFLEKKEKKRHENFISQQTWKWMESNLSLRTTHVFKLSFFTETPNNMQDWKIARQEVKTNSFFILM
jgi:hypothetical protein